MKPLPNNVIRNTFGLRDSETQQKYEDIISAHLENRILSLSSLKESNYIIAETRDRNKLYTVLLDSKAEQALKQGETTKAIISFQVRTNGCFAIARLFQDKQDNRKEEEENEPIYNK